MLFPIDNLRGPGVEVFHLVDAADASYVVGAAFYDADDNALVTATARVFVDGALVHDASHAFSRQQQWLPARIDVDSGVASVVVLDDASAQAGGCL